MAITCEAALSLRTLFRRWGIAGNTVVAWVINLPAADIAAAVFGLVRGLR